MSAGIAKVKLVGSAGQAVPQGRDVGYWDFLYTASVVKDPVHDIGDRVVLPDGRVYRYARVPSGGTAYAGEGCKFNNEEVIKYAAVYGAAIVGDRSIQVTVANTDGKTANGAIAADELRGGYIIVYGASNSDVQQRGIISNTVVAAGGGTITIYLDGPLVKIATARSCEVLGNLYDGVSFLANRYASVLGIAAAEATSLQYYWLQTWGPCWISPAGAGVGGQLDERQCVFNAQGALIEHSAAEATTKAQQHAGFVIQKDSGAGDGPPFIMLQISP